MPVDTIAARNKRIKELEDELRRRQEIIDDARIRMDDRLKRAEAAEARVAELERERREIESARDEIGGMEGDEHIHCGQMIAKEMGLRFGVERDRDAWRSDSMLHRQQRDEARARADRLAEAAESLKAAADRARGEKVTVGCWHQLLVSSKRATEALAAYRSDSPPNTEGEKT